MAKKPITASELNRAVADAHAARQKIAANERYVPPKGTFPHAEAAAAHAEAASNAAARDGTAAAHRAAAEAHSKAQEAHRSITNDRSHDVHTTRTWSSKQSEKHEHAAYEHKQAAEKLSKTEAKMAPKNSQTIAAHGFPPHHPAAAKFAQSIGHMARGSEATQPAGTTPEQTNKRSVALRHQINHEAVQATVTARMSSENAAKVGTSGAHHQAGLDHMAAQDAHLAIARRIAPAASNDPKVAEKFEHHMARAAEHEASAKKHFAAEKSAPATTPGTAKDRAAIISSSPASAKAHELSAKAERASQAARSPDEHGDAAIAHHKAADAHAAAAQKLASGDIPKDGAKREVFEEHLRKAEDHKQAANEHSDRQFLSGNLARAQATAKSSSAVAHQASEKADSITKNSGGIPSIAELHAHSDAQRSHQMAEEAHKTAHTLATRAGDFDAADYHFKMAKAHNMSAGHHDDVKEGSVAPMKHGDYPKQQAEIQTGPKGGQYVVGSGGSKHYVK